MDTLPPLGFATTELQALLHQRIMAIDFESAKQDVVKFIPDAKVLNIWSTDYFLQLADWLAGSNVGSA